ncbi:DUF6406 domain-containing protein [Actinomadura chokoriensis]|uniref:DUF6406 domain-containing protein n=1 Tax=Actinomadura chokoriensis TaxID=454156 RepID=UPI0031F90C37
MSINEIVLGPDGQRNTSIGSFGVVHVDVREGHPLTVRLAVETDEDRAYTLQPGGTFPVGDQVWKLERVENPGSEAWAVVLTRVP